MPTIRVSLASLRLDFRTGLPAFLQVVQQVQRQVAQGRLRAGQQLPTVRELAAILGVNFNTVARAYRVLDQAGVVSTQQGRGTFVTDRHAAGRTRRVDLRTLAAQYVAAAKRGNFSADQIAAMVATQLGRHPAATRTGESHG